MKDWSSMVPVLSISSHIRTTDAETEDAFNSTKKSHKCDETCRPEFCDFHFSNMLVNTPDPIVTVIGLLPLPHDDTR